MKTQSENLAESARFGSFEKKDVSKRDILEVLSGNGYGKDDFRFGNEDDPFIYVFGNNRIKAGDMAEILENELGLPDGLIRIENTEKGIRLDMSDVVKITNGLMEGKDEFLEMLKDIFEDCMVSSKDGQYYIEFNEKNDPDMMRIAQIGLDEMRRIGQIYDYDLVGKTEDGLVTFVIGKDGFVS